ncbi:Wzz/FepE/Etk N-terminal domain-containing protein [Kitasatospora sp. NPDC092039]|uniref:Wzz/FepE/Etk N-terminal domain-containing protein n=1 Tax=Kitasatospora sp. NPDC092039 TaxID=3364086 RepID=UPI003825DD4D
MTTPRRSARRLVRRWWPVVLAVPLGAAAGAGYAVVAHPSYAANAYVLVVAQNPGEAAIATNFAQAYGRLAGQPQVLAVAAAETGRTRSELASLVRGTTSPDAPMIEITGTGPRPQEAARNADAVARSLVSFANTSSRDTNVRLVTLSPAAAPDRPTTPSGKLDVAVGGAAGLLLGSLAMMTRRRGGSGTPEAADGSPEAPRTLRALRAAKASEAPVAAAPVAVPTTPRPRREEPATAVAGAGPDSAPPAPEAGSTPGPAAEAAATEGVKAADVKTERAKTADATAEDAKTEDAKAGDAKAGDAKAEGAKGEGQKSEAGKADKKAGKKTAGKAGRRTGAEPAAAERPPVEEPAPAADEPAPAAEEPPAVQEKAAAGSGR